MILPINRKITKSAEACGAHHVALEQKPDNGEAVFLHKLIQGGIDPDRVLYWVKLKSSRSSKRSIETVVPMDQLWSHGILSELTMTQNPKKVWCRAWGTSRERPPVVLTPKEDLKLD